MTAGNRLAVIVVLGTAQTLAWASSFYLPAILGDRIAEDQASQARGSSQPSLPRWSSRQ
jgi:hypothetical protein